MTTPKLRQVEWIEIALGVSDKLTVLKSGVYGRDKVTRAWQHHLEDILETLGPTATSGVIDPKLSEDDFNREDWQEIFYCIDNDGQLAKKIGPDGEKMYNDDED